MAARSKDVIAHPCDQLDSGGRRGFPNRVCCKLKRGVIEPPDLKLLDSGAKDALILALNRAGERPDRREREVEGAAGAA